MSLDGYKKYIVKLLMCLCLIAFAQDVFAAKPLLQEGKTSVYQRVVTHPGAKLYAGADAGAAVLRDPLKTFSVMYIYDKQGDRMQVGASTNKADGWVDANKITEWPQAITMVFSDRASGRDPVLFFRDKDELVKVCEMDDLGPTLAKFRETVQGSPDNVPDNYPVIAAEPSETAVSEKNFYLLPVLDVDDSFYVMQGPRLLEVASINPGIGGGKEEEEGPQGAKGAKSESDLRTGFAFVIDTTISMKPYIDQTLELIRNLYDELEKSPYADKMAFAVVAFRNNVDRAPGSEYTAKVICDFTTVKDRKELEDALGAVREASVRTPGVNEDSFAGVKEAVDHLSWDDYGGRVMMMVTDAGPLGADDDASTTGFTPETLAEYLRAKKIYLTALHVKNPNSPMNKKNAAYAEKAYKALTKQSDNQASYIGVIAGNAKQGAKAFDSAGKTLAESYANVAAATAEGKFLPKPTQKSSKNLSPEDEAKRIAESTGYAIQLQFLGNRAKSTAPQVETAWITDADLEKLAANPNNAPVLAVEPAVLLTKSQLSNLYKQLGVILDSAEAAFLDGNTNIFQQIASAAAQLSRDPGQFTLHPDQNLAENGLLDEVLQGLPYKSVIGTLKSEDWENMSTGQRDSFIRRIKSLRAAYKDYEADNSKWESFGATNPNDWVYRVPLSMLP